MSCKHGYSTVSCVYCAAEVRPSKNPFTEREFDGWRRYDDNEGERYRSPVPASAYDISRLEGEVSKLNREVTRLQQLVTKLITVFAPGEKV